MTVDIKKLRTQLRNEWEHLNEELEQLKSSAPSADDSGEGSSFTKREEEATETLEMEKRLALESRLSQELAAIEHALQKLKEGTYGLCDSCGKHIAPERLEALPQASLCLTCKAQQAKNAKGKPPSG